MEYLDFELEIGLGSGREYPLAVVSSPGGEGSATMHFPFDELALESHLKDVQIALLRSGDQRRHILSTEELSVQDFGRALFEALFVGEVRSRYEVSQLAASNQDKGLRVKLRIQPPELARLPWEFLYSSTEREYVCLSSNTPLVRYIELPRPPQPLTITPPLRLLGMTASPRDLAGLDVVREKQRIERAIQGLQEQGAIELTWLEGQTADDLQRAMRAGPWHVFHFIGHGDFNVRLDEGLIALVDDEGKADFLRATDLARLLADHRTLRLVVLNSCEGAHGGIHDLFSSTAAILVGRGIPAVLAMQYDITDRAAITLARAFYTALADGMPVDAAVSEARKTMSIRGGVSVEWGTPVLYMHSPDGVLFHLTRKQRPLQVKPDVTAPESEASKTRPGEQRIDEHREEVSQASHPLSIAAEEAPSVSALPAEMARSWTPPVKRPDAMIAAKPVKLSNSLRIILIGLVGLIIVALIAYFTLPITPPPVPITTSGAITEFPIPTSGNAPRGITAGPDGNLWFTESSNKIGRITTSGAITEFPTPPSRSDPNGITAGRDGNLWFTEAYVNKIGRISTKGVVTEFSRPMSESGFRSEGVVTEFSLPMSGSGFRSGGPSLGEITAGPDGNLWFTYSGGKIGRITTGGVITGFPVPTANSGPDGITAGPDGNLWFTERFVNKIGRITTGGVITGFPVPTANSNPLGITAGPDGNLWFTEAAGKIGRITTGGVITGFPVPTANSSPDRITAGPDGNLWFTEAAGNKIGRITTSGAITEFPIPTSGSRPYGITAGPDGNLWFTEATGKIGRITSGK